ncbi:MAG TPA: spermidine/putrescine ABC transporter substrate-binding protein [Actinomycetota bacterium]|nr:spermidine/putrescine ABC transporter substrate-binding protein [Actinomycetota bacterium]
MTEREDRDLTDRLLQDAMRKRLSRRSVLRGAGVGVAGIGLASLLAACGEDTGGGNGGTQSGGAPADVFGGEPGDTVNFANWPLYLDQAKDKDGNVYHPTLKLFEDATGIHVSYEDVIQSNEEFYGKIQPQLAGGDPTGWDIIVITNGRQFNVLTTNEWVYRLDTTKRPNFDANATSFARDPSYDPGNVYSMAWQGGFTGVGYDTTKVSAPITKLDDLANPDIVGTDSVGMLAADMPDFVMINLGIDPATSGPAEWQEAADWLTMQRDSGTVRQYYDQGYIDDVVAGNTPVSMAWSGDILYYKVWAGYPDLEFIIPEGGALLWQDNMLVPVGAANAPGALQVMDWYYDPKIATMVTEWVLYLSPAEGVQERIQDDVKAALDDGYKGYANKLTLTAESPFAFPDEALLAQTKFGTNITSDEQAEEWDNIFLPITQQ